MPDSPSAASTAAAAAMANDKHCPPRITHDSGDFLVLHGKFGGTNKGFGEAPKSCTRKAHESATNSIARRGQGWGLRPFSSVPCRVKGRDFVPFRLSLAGSRGGTSSLFVCLLWGLGQRPNCSSSDQSQGSRQQRRRQRSIPASNFARPQTRLQAALPPIFREKTFFLPASCRFPAKSLNPLEFFPKPS